MKKTYPKYYGTIDFELSVSGSQLHFYLHDERFDGFVATEYLIMIVDGSIEFKDDFSELTDPWVLQKIVELTE